MYEEVAFKYLDQTCSKQQNYDRNDATLDVPLVRLYKFLDFAGRISAFKECFGTPDASSITQTAISCPSTLLDVACFVFFSYFPFCFLFFLLIACYTYISFARFSRSRDWECRHLKMKDLFM